MSVDLIRSPERAAFLTLGWLDNPAAPDSYLERRSRAGLEIKSLRPFARIRTAHRM
jgi:hypothetical protein